MGPPWKLRTIQSMQLSSTLKRMPMSGLQNTLEFHTQGKLLTLLNTLPSSSLMLPDRALTHSNPGLRRRNILFITTSLSTQGRRKTIGASNKLMSSRIPQHQGLFEFTELVSKLIGIIDCS